MFQLTLFLQFETVKYIRSTEVATTQSMESRRDKVFSVLCDEFQWSLKWLSVLRKCMCRRMSTYLDLPHTMKDETT